MKKVGIITYHFAQNYGAVLQCYALQTYLSQQGYAVTVFDFVSEKQQKNNDVVKHGASVKTAVAPLRRVFSCPGHGVKLRSTY